MVAPASERVATTSPTAMVISAEPPTAMVISAEPPPPPHPDPVADAAVDAAVEAAAASSARQAAFSSSPSLKMWEATASYAVPMSTAGRGGDAIATARRPAEELREVGEKLLSHHDEVEAAGSDANAAAEEAPEPASSSPSRLRTRRRRGAVAPPASASPPTERRPSRAARGEPLDRARFSVTLTTDEIEEDIYAFTGARARRRPRRQPRPVQKQLDMLFPGLGLSEITAETYWVRDNR